MRLIPSILVCLFVTVGAIASQPESAYGKMDFSPGAIERGKAVFMSHCNACHGLKYYRGKENTGGIPPAMDPKSAEAAFGAVPPDLSLIALARGKRYEGAMYIYELLTTYYTDEKGLVKNRAFAEETQGDGTIAMPPPIPIDDPELGRKSIDVAAFLLDVADPAAAERKRTGKYVLAYMFILTALLYTLNRVTWKGIKKKF